MRTVYVWDPETQSLILKDRAQPGRATAVISDALPDLEHPGDGCRYDSKRAFRAATRRAGLEEVGDQGPALLRQAAEARAARSDYEDRTAQNAVHEAIRMVENGYRPSPVDRMRGNRVI